MADLKGRSCAAWRYGHNSSIVCIAVVADITAYQAVQIWSYAWLCPTLYRVVFYSGVAVSSFA